MTVTTTIIINESAIFNTKTWHIFYYNFLNIKGKKSHNINSQYYLQRAKLGWVTVNKTQINGHIHGNHSQNFLPNSDTGSLYLPSLVVVIPLIILFPFVSSVSVQ